MSDGYAARLLDEIMAAALELEASDIHLEAGIRGGRVRLRIDGRLQLLARQGPVNLSPLLTRLKLLAGMDIAEQRLPQDGRLSYQQGGRRLDLRLSTLPTNQGEKMAIRLLESQRALLPLEQLGFSPANLGLYRGLYRVPNGLVLLTGPTGSGKTTTLYATLQELNSPDKNIITIEDPIEYQLPGINQVAVNPKAGLTFATGLRALVRQDPDIIMVGEIRDRETAAMALGAALTGHLVLSTMHANRAAASVSRLLEMGVEPFLVAATLRGTVAQRLVRRLCPHCAGTAPATPLEAAFCGCPPGTLLPRAQGCPACAQLGYKGRLALQEVLPITGGMRELIVRASQRELEGAVTALGEEAGYKSLYADGLAKLGAGLTTVGELMSTVEGPPNSFFS